MAEPRNMALFHAPMMDAAARHANLEEQQSPTPQAPVAGADAAMHVLDFPARGA